MKKTLFALSMLLPLAMMNDANAQRANHTKKDVGTRIEETYDNAVKEAKKDTREMKNKIEKHHKKDKHDKKTKDKKGMKPNQEEINKDYEKAIKKIEKSQFNDDQKKLLTQQAMENRDLAVKQLNERAELMKKHRDARMNDKGFLNAAKADKANKKAVKEVSELLDD